MNRRHFLSLIPKAAGVLALAPVLGATPAIASDWEVEVARGDVQLAVGRNFIVNPDFINIHEAKELK